MCAAADIFLSGRDVTRFRHARVSADRCAMDVPAFIVEGSGNQTSVKHGFIKNFDDITVFHQRHASLSETANCRKQAQGKERKPIDSISYFWCLTCWTLMEIQFEGTQGKDMPRKGIISAGTGELDECELVLAGKRGDERAAEALFRRYHSLLFQTAFRVLRNKEDAEDSLQDAFVSAYCNLERFEGRSQFSTWLTRIVINAALMRRRSIKARRSVSLDDILREDELPGMGRFSDPGPNPEQIYLRIEVREMINKNIDELSPRLRIAFLLRHMAGESTAQAAKELGVAQNALKARVWRARHRLAERLRPLQGMAAP